MGLFDFFKTKPKTSNASQPHMPVSSGLSRADATQPFQRGEGVRSGSAKALPPASIDGESQREQRKNARYVRRELLYAVVHESMIRAGVLSQGYKFKALALDPRGLQFIVMVDLAAEFGASHDRWAEIESLIAQSAKVRHGVIVKAVYWRLSDQVSVGKPSPGALPSKATSMANDGGVAVGAMAQAASAGIALAESAAQQARAEIKDRGEPSPAKQLASGADSPTSRPMPLFPTGPAEDPEEALDFDVTSDHAGRLRPQTPGSGRFEPIADDEVEAFKRALASGANAQQALAAAHPGATVPGKKPSGQSNSYTLLTGFEDTEAADPDFAPPALGSTQYGELR